MLTANKTRTSRNLNIVRTQTKVKSHKALSMRLNHHRYRHSLFYSQHKNSENYNNEQRIFPHAVLPSPGKKSERNSILILNENAKDVKDISHIICQLVTMGNIKFITSFCIKIIS